MSFGDIARGNQVAEAYALIGAWFPISCSYLSWIGRLAARAPGRHRQADVAPAPFGFAISSFALL
jgi:general L-amino acid transport system permease protein